MKSWYKVKSILAYYLRASTRFDIHSPYLSALIKSAIEQKVASAKFADIESIRSSMLSCEQAIKSVDLGAGSVVTKSPARTISSIAKSSLSVNRDCKIYYNIVQFLKPKHMLELGTCLGISTAYFQRGSEELRITTIEGNPDLAKFATENLTKLFHSGGPKVVQGLFENALPKILKTDYTIDLVFIDGDHSYHGLTKAVQMIKPHLSRGGMIILHDIHWSEGMNKAWKEISRHTDVKLAIDLYTMGLISYHPDVRSPQQVTLINYWLKPWRLGLFAQ